jgi:hypothetical protein
MPAFSTGRVNEYEPSALMGASPTFSDEKSPGLVNDILSPYLKFPTFPCTVTEFCPIITIGNNSIERADNKDFLMSRN